MPLSRTCLVVLFFALSFQFQEEASAQVELSRIDGPPGSSRFGNVVLSDIELDGDGVADFLVSGSSSIGATVWGYSGASGTELFALGGFAVNFGAQLENTGDLDGDGIDDFAVGMAESTVLYQPPVVLYSGATATVIRQYVGGPASTNDRFGSALCNVGDIDGDSINDLAVSAWAANPPNLSDVQIFSGADGAVIRTFGQSPFCTGLGYDMTSVPDVNGDGVDELVIVASLCDPNNVVYLFDGASGGQVWLRAIPARTAQATGDVDGDGVSDIVVGFLDTLYHPDGIVRVLSGADGEDILEVFGSSLGTGYELGGSVYGLGDVTGDGVGDFAATLTRPVVGGGLTLFSGADLQQVWTFLGPFSPNYSSGVRSTPDKNGDGVRDLMLGPVAFSEAVGFYSWTPASPVGANYCVAAMNSVGTVGEMSAVGTDLVSANALSITASSLPPNAFGFFLASLDPGFVLGTGGVSNGNLCLGGSIGRFVGPGQIQDSGTAGSFSLSLDLQSLPQPNGLVSASAGETWNFQAWHREAAGLGSNLTDGIEVTFR